MAIDGTRVGPAAAGRNRSAGKAADNTGIGGSGSLAAEAATVDGAVKAIHRAIIKLEPQLQGFVAHWTGGVSLMTTFTGHFLVDHMGGVGAGLPAWQNAGGRISEAILAKISCNGGIAVAGITTGAKSFAMAVAVGAVIAVGSHMVEFTLAAGVVAMHARLRMTDLANSIGRGVLITIIPHGRQASEFDRFDKRGADGGGNTCGDFFDVGRGLCVAGVAGKGEAPGTIVICAVQIGAVMHEWVAGSVVVGGSL